MIKYLENTLKNKKNIFISLFSAVFILITIFPGYPVYSEHSKVKPEWVMPKHYPEWFNGWGRVGYLEGNEIVINDMDYRLAPSVTYHTPDRINSRYEFNTGKLVGFLFNDNDEIVSLWLITMKKQS